MVALWVIFGLIVATFAVSTLGAAFSVIGLAALFSGAALAVIAMATSLEFAKFVLSAYLHQRWLHLNRIFRTYLLFAIVILSGITSMGIFGFLSQAYQSASSTLEAENLKMDALKQKQTRNAKEIERLNKNIDEIPPQRISRRLKARAEAEPIITALEKDSVKLDKQIAESNLKILDVKQKVGPLIYIAKVFKADIDTVVKYLILVLVLVFDPLAICLVIATSEALEARRQFKLQSANIRVEPKLESATVVAAPAPAAPPVEEVKPAPTPRFPMSDDHPSEPIPTAETPSVGVQDAEEVLKMRFAPDDDGENAV